jgi:hypothetical protein
MKRITLLTIFLGLTAAISTFAQQKGVDKNELAVYGTFIRGDVRFTDAQHPQLSFDQTRDSFGGMIEGSEYFGDGPLAFTVSGSVNRSGTLKMDVITFGITAKANRHGRIQPFLTAGFGVSHQNNYTRPPQSGIFLQNFGNGGAVNVGAGIEVKLSKHVGLVPIRADYLRTDMFHKEVPARNNVRLAAGLVFHW